MNKKLFLSILFGILASVCILLSMLYMGKAVKYHNSYGQRIDNLENASDAQQSEKISESIADINDSINSLKDADTENSNQINLIKDEFLKLGVAINELPNGTTSTTTTDKTPTDTASTNTTDTTKTNTTSANENTKDTTNSADNSGIKEQPINAKPTNQNPNFVSNTNLNFRTGAGLEQHVNRVLTKDEKLVYQGEEKSIAGLTWLKVKDSSGKEGWVAEKYTSQ